MAALRMGVFFTLHLGPVAGYAAWWTSCEEIPPGRRIMRHPAKVSSPDDVASVYFQVYDENMAVPKKAPDGRSLRVYGLSLLVEDRKGLRAARAARQEALDTDAAEGDEEEEEVEDEDEFFPADCWHRGLGEILRKSTEDLANIPVEEALSKTLLIWPFLESSFNWQYTLTASSGVLEALPEEHIIISNVSGGLLDPTLVGDEEADSEALALGRSMLHGLYYVADHCEGLLAASRKSVPGRFAPPLLWIPPKDPSAQLEGLRISMAFARGRKVQLVAAQLGQVDSAFTDEEDEKKEEWDEL